MDVFGPWQVVSRKTRGGSASSKRWGVLFTCLVIRAIHIEVIDSLSSSAFINALRWFISIRGKVQIFRSDRGTKFVGATDDLHTCIDKINVEDDKTKQYLFNSGIKWIFNPPHSSHFGGSWERMIGVVKRILDGMMLDPNNHNITHEALCTLLAEGTAIVNSRPITFVSTDPDSPFVLTPNTLLTQKFVSSDKCEFMCNEFNRKDMLKSAWKRVQGFANQFRKRWQSEYLHLLQVRRKWEETAPNVKEGDVVLVKSDEPICQWPLATIQQVYES